MAKFDEQLATGLKTFQEEFAKFEGGNKTAGVRARKALMDIKEAASEGRKYISSANHTAGSEANNEAESAPAAEEKEPEAN